MIGVWVVAVAAICTGALLLWTSVPELLESRAPGASGALAPSSRGPSSPQNTAPVADGTPAVSAADVGASVLAVVGTTEPGGAPLFAFSSASGVGLIRCARSDCATPEIQLLRPGAGATSLSVSAPEGLPSVGFLDPTTGTVKVAACLDQGCHATTEGLLAPGGPVTSSGAIAAGADGALAAYIDAQQGQIGLIPCEPCGGGPDTELQESSIGSIADPAGASVAVAVRPDGAPVIAYEASDTGLTAAICNDLTCSYTTTVALASSDSIAGTFAFGLGPSGDPIALFSDTDGALTLTRCPDATCADDPVPSVIGQGATAWAFTVDPDGVPVAIVAETGGTTRFLRCGDPLCTTLVADVVLPVAGPQAHLAIAIGADGRPMIASVRPDGRLSIVNCGDPFCTSHRTP